MRLSERVYYFYYPNGIICDIDPRKINITIDGKITDKTFQDVLVKFKIHRKGIIGYSPLQYFYYSEGKFKCGNTLIGFIDLQSQNKLYITNTKKFIYMDDMDVDMKYIDNFCQNIIPIKDPIDIFHLKESEVTELNKIRDCKNNDILKKSINQKYIYDDSEFEKVKKLFNKDGKANEYIFNQYHIFYNPEDKETALFVNHGNWFHEITCSQYQVSHDTTTDIYNYTFDNDGYSQKLTLNLKAGEIAVNPLNDKKN